VAYYNEDEEERNYSGYKGIYSPSTSIGRKFAEKSRYDGMVAQMDEETKRRYVNDQDYRYEVDKSFGFKQQYNNPVFQDERYTQSASQGNNRGALAKVIDFISTGNYMSAGFATGVVKGEGLGGSLKRAGQGILAGFTGNDEHSYTYSDVIKEAGYEKEENKDGKWYNPATWSGKNTAINLAGFAGDVLLDPTTYLGIGLADDVAKGTGKVVKGAVAGADDIVTKSGGKSVIKAMTQDDAVKVFKSLKGDNFIPQADEVAELIRRTNKTRGIREVQPITAFGKEVISGDTMSKLRNPIRELGDKTIAPYTQKVADFLKHSKLSTKGDLIDMARTSPTGLKQYFDFAEEAGKHGLTHSQALVKAGERFNTYNGLDDETNSLVVKLMEDKKLFDKIGNKYKTQVTSKAEQQVASVVNNQTDDVLDTQIKEARELVDKKPTLEQIKEHKVRNFQEGWGTPNKESIPDTAKVVSIDNTGTQELKNGKVVSKKLSVDKSKRTLPNPYDYSDAISNTDKVAKQYKVDFIPQIDDTRIAETGSLYLKGTDMPVDFMKPNYLEGANISELKDIAKKMRVKNYSKYTTANKDELAKGIREMFEPQKYVKEARLKSGILERFNIDPTDTKNAITSLNTESKRRLINDIVKQDEYMNNIFKHMANKGELSTEHLSEKQMNTFIKKYFDGDLKHFVSTSHQLNKNYPKIATVIGEEFGSRETLTASEKALRMDKVWDYINNPKLLDKKYNQLELKNSFGTRGLDADVAMDVDRVLSEKIVEVDGRILSEGRTTAPYVDDIENQITKQNKNLQDFEGSRFTQRDIYDGTDVKELMNKPVKRMIDESYFDDAIGKKQLDELDSLIKKNNGNIPASLASKMAIAETTGKKITSEELASIIKAPKVKKEIDIERLDEFLGLTGDVSKRAEELNTLPSDMQKKIVKPSEEVVDAVKTVRSLEPEKYNTVTNAIKNAQKDIDNIAQVESVVTKADDVVDIERTLTDTEKKAYDIASELREEMRNIGQREVAIGKLSEKKYKAMMDDYMAHVMTPQAQGSWENLKKTNPDMYNLMQAGNKGNKHNITRTFAKGSTLPDGYVLKTGSIEEINEHMAQYINGNKMFADKVSDIYLARMTAHQNVMYDYKLADDIVGKFGIKVKPGETLGKGEAGIIKTADIKNALNKIPDAKKAEVYAKLGIEEGYFNSTYKSFMNLTPSQVAYLSKSKSVPVYKVSKVMADKADSLAKTQFATDLNVLVKTYDKFLTLWKTNVTATRPGFHFRNAQSNAFQNYLDVGVRAYDPAFNKKMLDIASGKEGFHTILGKKMSYKEIQEKAVQHGVLDNGFFEKELANDAITALDGKINPKYNPLNAKEFGVYKAGRKLGNKVENQARLANFVANLERGKGFQEASEHVNKFLFDYSDLAPIEQNVMKRLVPFYTWLRKNVPLQAEMITSAPQKYLPFVKAINMLNKGKGDMPDYAKDWVQLPYTTKDKDGKEYNIMWNNSLPYNDLSKVTSAKDMWGGITPFIKIPVELIAGKNIFFDQDIKGERGEYLKDQIPGRYEAKKMAEATGGKKAVAISDYTVGSGLKTMETEKSRKSSSGDKFSSIYKRYLKEKANK